MCGWERACERESDREGDRETVYTVSQAGHMSRTGREIKSRHGRPCVRHEGQFNRRSTGASTHRQLLLRSIPPNYVLMVEISPGLTIVHELRSHASLGQLHPLILPHTSILLTSTVPSALSFHCSGWKDVVLTVATDGTGGPTEAPSATKMGFCNQVYFLLGTPIGRRLTTTLAQTRQCLTSERNTCSYSSRSCRRRVRPVSAADRNTLELSAILPWYWNVLGMSPTVPHHQRGK